VDEPRVETTTAPRRLLAVVRVQATRTQRMWWVPFALIAAFSVAAAIAIIDQWGVGEGLLKATILPGLMVGVGVFVSVGLLRQSMTATGTTISVSAVGVLTVHEPTGETGRSLVGAKRLSVRHGVTVARLYGADMPNSLASSGPRGAIVIEYEDRAETLEFTGELPLRDQQQLLLAAERFIPRGAGEAGLAALTPDERYRATSFGHRLLDFGALLVKALVLMLPFWAVMVIRISMEGHSDPNTRWLTILIVAAGATVVVVGIVRAMRRWGRPR
jgi:hypothetical protein